MSWQEELRVLDEELATGRISADEYRVRRDKVMSSAISPQHPQQHDQQSEKTQYVAPVQPPQQAAEGDRTQVVPGGSGDRTQAVTGGWQAARPGADADRTQVVPGANMPMGGHMPPHAMPGPPPPPWGHQPQHEEMAPPWAGSDFPPLAASSPDWIKQGPEVFDSQGGGKGKVVALVVVILLVLGGLGVGAYFMFFKESSPSAGPSTTDQAPTTTTTPPPPPDPLPVGTMPGKVTVNRAVTTFADMPGQRYLTDGEIAAYTAGKPTDTKLVICDLGSGNRLVVMLVQMPSAAAAQKAAKDLHKVQTGNGMETQSGSPAGVQVATREAKDGKAGRFRAHFASGDIVVRLDLSTKDTSDGQVTFNDSLAGQLEKTPADG
ncbi:hypothetical protein [Actinokineospora fastidiosa]|uniref:Flagellar basal body-associated protein FliL n=1 Tax=Actinokineospora fastidiosa TaxID=1816 RepID=A0A918L8H4_9PSEU|nr:hypothetical protein [Actinokineospora fastidiosa]GGS18554.1 hypothetical protein GCM10010171_08860 [Actinokineospora fastidiosa]